MKKSMILMAALLTCGQIFAVETKSFAKDVAYATGVNIINAARSYELQILGAFNVVTKIGVNDTLTDMGHVTLNPVTNRFTIRAINPKTGQIVAELPMVRQPNQDVFVVNVASSGGLTTAKITYTAYSAEMAASMPKYEKYDL